MGNLRKQFVRIHIDFFMFCKDLLVHDCGCLVQVRRLYTGVLVLGGLKLFLQIHWNPKLSLTKNIEAFWKRKRLNYSVANIE